MSTTVLLLALMISAVGDLGCTIIAAEADAARQSAVRESHQKYVATTLAIVFYTAAVILKLVLVCMLLLLSRSDILYTFLAGLWMIFAVLDARRLYRVLKSDDDNWFNSQYGKLKRGVKNLRSKLSFSPRLQPALG